MPRVLDAAGSEVPGRAPARTSLLRVDPVEAIGSPTVLYAAYGSNLDPRQMAARCPHSPLRGTGWVTGWRLTFGGDGWDGALPTVVESAPGAREDAFVAVYDVTRADEKNLDEWESADDGQYREAGLPSRTGLYRKITVRVTTLNGELSAWVYVLNDFEGGLPSARTLGLLADAADAAAAPADYVTALRARPSRRG